MHRVPVAVVGASGYTGAELIRLLLSHPSVQLAGVYARRTAGEPLSGVFPQFQDRLDLEIRAFDAAEVAGGARVAFLGLPHGESAAIARELYDHGLIVIDLSADLRLRDPAAYQTWYGRPGDPLCQHAIYGLPELAAPNAFTGARLIAVPGCYPTAALLALKPLLEAGLLEPAGLIVDAKSGISGAGRQPTATTHFGEVGESVRAYQVAGTHRHLAELEQELGISGIVFTPHLVPMSRGILATCYGVPGKPEREPAAYRQALERFYAGRRLISVVDAPPATAHVRGSNRAHVFVTFDARARRVIAMCAIDNLTKGASGQAVQCMNLALGFDETAGLDGVAIFP